MLLACLHADRRDVATDHLDEIEILGCGPPHDRRERPAADTAAHEMPHALGHATRGGAQQAIGGDVTVAGPELAEAAAFYRRHRFITIPVTCERGRSESQIGDRPRLLTAALVAACMGEQRLETPQTEQSRERFATPEFERVGDASPEQAYDRVLDPELVAAVQRAGVTARLPVQRDLDAAIDARERVSVTG